MSEDLRGALIERFEVDPKDQRILSRVRTWTAILGAAAALLVLLGRVPIAVFLVALLALFVSALWLLQGLRARARAKQPQEHYLAVHDAGVCVSEGEKITWIPWASVREVEVDEERLDIVILRSPGDPFRIEPRYPGVEIHELMRRLRNAWLRACDRRQGMDVSIPR